MGEKEQELPDGIAETGIAAIVHKDGAEQRGMMILLKNGFRVVVFGDTGGGAADVCIVHPGAENQPWFQIRCHPTKEPVIESAFDIVEKAQGGGEPRGKGDLH